MSIAPSTAFPLCYSKKSSRRTVRRLTLQVSDSASRVQPEVSQSVSAVDPYVQQAIVGTNGMLYQSLRGKLIEYPIPN
jgi:hypothetical protein